MSDLISKSRAHDELSQMADSIEKRLTDSEYGAGFVAGYRAAAAALRSLLDERTLEIIAEMKAEAAE